MLLELIVVQPGVFIERTETKDEAYEEDMGNSLNTCKGSKLLTIEIGSSLRIRPLRNMPLCREEWVLM